MQRMFGRRWSQTVVPAGADRVLAAISMPSESRLNDFKATVHINLTTGSIFPVNQVVGYALEMWILPVHDPDGALTYDTIFDRLVPKDTDVQAMDLDTGASDAGPFWEPGEADWSKLLRVGLQPEKLYARHKLLSYANANAKVIDNETPFLPGFIPNDVVEVRVKKNYYIENPSVVVLAMASPSFDDTTAVAQAPLLENEWARVKYITEVMKMAQIDLFGLVESGAETPWEEATDLLQKHLQPDVFEETTSAFGNTSWTVFVEGMIDHSVVGQLGKAAISLG